jgi:hypothetical protein
MLLDSHTLKSGFVAVLPTPAPSGFVKRVNTGFTRIETLLKTMQVRPSPPEALVQAYLIHIADRNDSNFRKVLDLKGIKSKQEQSHLVDLLQIHRASDSHAPNLQQSNPLFAALQIPPHTSSSGTPGSVSQGLGLSTLGTSTIGSSNLPTRFDPSMLGSAIISAAKDGVDRFGNQGLSTLGSSAVGGGGLMAASGAASPAPSFGQSLRGETSEGSAAANLNENLKNIGKFFRRDLGSFGGRFGRSGEDGSGK